MTIPQRAMIVIFLCASAVGTATAEEGRIPIFEPIELSALTGDDVSGKYIVTRDIVAGADDTRVIDFRGSGTELVDIDLNGFTLTGPNPGYAIQIEDVRSVTIRNGSIVAGQWGVSLNGSQSGVADSVVLEDLRISGGTTNVLYIGSLDSVVVRRLIVVDAAAGLAIAAPPGAAPISGLVEDNVFRSTGSGITVTADSSNLRIRNNQMYDAGLLGSTAAIDIRNSRGASIADNSISGSAIIGIDVYQSTGCSVTRNNVVEVDGDGIRLFQSDSCLVLENVARGNQEYGILVAGDRHHVERNLTNDNGQEGLVLSGDDNTYGRNTSRGNTPFNPSCAPAGTCGGPELCDTGTGNSSFGDNLVPGPPPC